MNIDAMGIATLETELSLVTLLIDYCVIGITIIIKFPWLMMRKICNVYENKVIIIYLK